MLLEVSPIVFFRSFALWVLRTTHFYLQDVTLNLQSTGIGYRTAASVTPLFVVCAFECTYVSISDSLWLANVVEVFGGGGGYRGSLLSVRNTLHSSFI